MEQSLKNQLLNNYLAQQMGQPLGSQSAQAGQSQTQQDGGGDGTLAVRAEMPTAADLADFKGYVKAWIEVDNNIKKLRQAVKERNALKKQITQKITGFMSRFSIEDLNTQDGKLRYRVVQVKAPISQADIRTKLLEHHAPGTTAEELTRKIFDGREVIEKHSLRRFKPRGGGGGTESP